MESVNGMWVGVRAPCLCVNTEKDFSVRHPSNIVSHYHRFDCAHRFWGFFSPSLSHSSTQLYTHSTTFSRSPSRPLEERKAENSFLHSSACPLFPPSPRNINKNRFAAVLQELSLRLDVLSRVVSSASRVNV